MSTRASGYKIIISTNGRRILVDADVYKWAHKFGWHAANRDHQWYAIRTDRSKGTKTTARLHREIMKPPRGLVVDHINGNSLDCRRVNMRNCTQKQNSWNQRPKGKGSKYRGVTWHCRQRKWNARIIQDGLNHHIGCFISEIDAGHAYDQQAIIKFGKFARLNFPKRRST